VASDEDPTAVADDALWLKAAAMAAWAVVSLTVTRTLTGSPLLIA
jgi:hypothetical protein